MSLHNRNPIALLLALIPSTLAVVVWLNTSSALVCLALWLIVFAMMRQLRALWHPSTLAVVIAAMTAAVSMSLYGQSGGAVLWAWGPAVISQHSLAIAEATAVRVLAIAIPSIVLFRAIDLTRLADALEQTLRLPARAVWGSFAGLRQLELAQEDWRVVQLARRARGVTNRNPVRRAGIALFAVFSLAIERGGELAIAMEARGLGVKPRVPARQMPVQAADWVIVAVGVVIAVAVGWVAMRTGGSIAA